MYAAVREGGNFCGLADKEEESLGVSTTSYVEARDFGIGSASLASFLGILSTVSIGEAEIHIWAELAAKNILSAESLRLTVVVGVPATTEAAL